MRKFWIIGGLLAILFLIIGWFLLKEEVWLNPLSDKKNFRQTEGKLVTFGFLPTWMVGKTRDYGEELTHLIFLGIESDSEGNLIWDSQSKKINNESYLKLKKNIRKNGGRNILGVKLFDDKSLEELLKNAESRNNLVRQIKQVVDENGFDGVNIDFEFQNDPMAVLGDNFGMFLEEINKSKLGEISVDVFANTVIKGDGDKLKSFVEKMDYLVVMAYDFNRPGVDYTGAVAPIGSEIGERNIGEVVEKYLSLGLDKKKIILAYPLYGYEWKTTTKDFRAKIKRGWYQMASWKRTKELIKEKDLMVNWDELSMSPWINFEENGVNHQIYFENEKSLKAKIDLVKQNQFGGYGFWALGYEGEDNVFLLN